MLVGESGAVPAVLTATAVFPSTVISGALYVPADFTVHDGLIQILERCVSGYSGQYLAFQYSDSEYIVILADDLVLSENAFSTSSFSAYDIVFTDNSGIEEFSFSGEKVVVGANPSVENITGDYENYVARSGSYALYYDSFETDIMISNSNHGVLYSSEIGFAKLHDSAAHYGYYLSWAVSLFGVSVLIWSLFKRLK